MSRTAIILFAHGSRDPAWAVPFHAIRTRIAEAQPEFRVELAFLELMKPSLADVVHEVAASCDRVVIAPLFLGPGAHQRRDLTQLLADLRQRYASVEFHVLPGIGDMRPVLDAISAAIVKAAAETCTN